MARAAAPLGCDDQFLPRCSKKTASHAWGFNKIDTRDGSRPHRAFTSSSNTSAFHMP